MAGLLALMAILVSDQTVRMDQVQSGLRQIRAEACADAAVQQALAVISTTNAGLVTINDHWAQLGSAGAEEFDFPDGSSFREQVVAASSLINLNKATSAQMEQLPLDQDQVDSFLDWIQAGENARADGAKDSFYNGLPTPYNAKLGPLTTVNELTLINNWTAQTIYQSPTLSTILPLSTDTSGSVLPIAALLTVDSGSPLYSPTGTNLINLNTRTVSYRSLRTAGVNAFLANEIIERLPIANFLTLFSLRGITTAQKEILLNTVTFTTGTRAVGTVNLNTATLPVLESIPQVTPAIAASIVDQQSSGFQTLGQMATIGFSARQLDLVANQFSVGSDTWIVRAYGESGGVGDAVEAVVGFRSNHLEIISVNRLHTGGIPAWWGWDQATSTQQAGVTQ